jgi:hypothetical protein
MELTEGSSLEISVVEDTEYHLETESTEKLFLGGLVTFMIPQNVR